MSSQRRSLPPLPSNDGDTPPPLPTGSGLVPTSTTVSSLVEVFRCVICMDKLQDARLCPHCSKMCCFPCIRRWLTEQRSQCPHCRANLGVHELVNCRWAEEVTQQLDTLQQTVPPTTEENSNSTLTEECPEHQKKIGDYFRKWGQSVCYQCFFRERPHSGHILGGSCEDSDELSQLQSRHHELISLAEDVPTEIAPPPPPPPRPPSYRRRADSEPDPPELPARPPRQQLQQPEPPHPLSGYVWFHEDAGRQTADERVRRVNKEGAFLVRPSNRLSSYCLVVSSSSRKIYNVQISQRTDEQYAVGSEKPGEMRFGSVSGLIEHHLTRKIFIADGSLVLSHPVPRL